MKHPKVYRLKTYKVYYSGHASAKVRAYTTTGARRQAWNMLEGFKYGWSKSDFMKNATVKEV